MNDSSVNLTFTSNSDDLHDTNLYSLLLLLIVFYFTAEICRARLAANRLHRHRGAKFYLFFWNLLPSPFHSLTLNYIFKPLPPWLAFFLWSNSQVHIRVFAATLILIPFLPALPCQTLYLFADRITQDKMEEAEELFSMLPMQLVAPMNAATLNSLRSSRSATATTSRSPSSDSLGALSAGAGAGAGAGADGRVSLGGPLGVPLSALSTARQPRPTSLLSRAQAGGLHRTMAADDNYHAMLWMAMVDSWL